MQFSRTRRTRKGAATSQFTLGPLSRNRLADLRSGLDEYTADASPVRVGVLRSRWAAQLRRPSSPVPEEPARGARVAVPVVRDVAAVAVGPPAVAPVELGRDQAHPLH